VAAAVRLTFDPTQTELGPDGSAIIKQLVGRAPSNDNTTFNVLAYAAATPGDPSAARRTSLSRALAVRNALIADGVPSSRIYVRALGGQVGDGPADRADVSVLGTNAATADPAKPQ
jgi:outer membrane protein OmpA-like peptidoglycan-associated protein